jgi:hypothetical protein
MKINKATQLWEDLTADDVSKMKTWVESVVLHGTCAYPNPDWLMLWFSELEFNTDRQQLLLQPIAVPQRILLSIVKYYEDRCKANR